MAAAAGAYWFADEIAPGFVGSADPRVWAPVVRVLAVFLIPAVTSAAILAISQGVGEMTPAVVVDRIGATMLRLVGIVLVARSSGSPRELALAWCVPSVVSMIAATAWTAARMRRWGLVFRASMPAAWRVAGEFWSFTWARALGSVCQIALIWSDVLLIGVIRGPSVRGGVHRGQPARIRRYHSERGRGARAAAGARVPVRATATSAVPARCIE